MPVMAARRRNSGSPPPPGDPSSSAPEPPQANLQYPLRFIDIRLREAAERFGGDTHRTLNNALNVLIEAALKEAGYWPPPPESKTPG